MTNINTIDKYGRTPLIWAAINNSEYTAKRLLEAGADIDAQDKEGWTALMFASWNNYYSLAKMLIDFDANMELKNNRGRTALECAAWNKATQTADLLIMNSINSEDARSLYNNIVAMRNILQRPLNTGRTDSKIIKSILRDEGEWRQETQEIGLKKDKSIKTFSYTGLSWKFRNWLRTKEGKSENTAKQYAYSVRQIQRHFFENTTGVYCTDKENKKSITHNMIKAYSPGGQFEDFGTYGHNTRICALRAYLRFLNSIYPDSNNIEENINSQHTNSAAETTKSTSSAICSEKDSRCITKKQSILSKMNQAEYTSPLNLLESKTKTEDSNIVNNVATFIEENSGENHTESFFKAVESNDVQKIQELLQSGIDINAKDKDGWTPLIYAASKKATDIAKILIETGADLNATDNCGWTALMDAVDKNSIDIVKLLINAGAELEIRNNEEKTAIMLAKGSEADKIIALLKDAGAEPQSLISTTLPHEQKKEVEALLKEDIINDVSADFKNVSKNAGAVISEPVEADMKKCDIPLVFEIHKLAKTRNCKEVLSLIQPNAYIDSEDSFGWTALMYAVRDNAVDIAKILIDAGSNIHKTTKAGKTVLKIASDNKAKDVERLLRDAGAN